MGHHSITGKRTERQNEIQTRKKHICRVDSLIQNDTLQKQSVGSEVL